MTEEKEKEEGEASGSVSSEASGEAEKLGEVMEVAKEILQKQEKILALIGEVDKKQPTMNSFAIDIRQELGLARDKGAQVPKGMWDKMEELYHMQFQVTGTLTYIWQEDVKLRALYRDFLKALAELFWKLSMT